MSKREKRGCVGASGAHTGQQVCVGVSVCVFAGIVASVWKKEVQVLPVKDSGFGLGFKPFSIPRFFPFSHQDERFTVQRLADYYYCLIIVVGVCRCCLY